MGDWKLNTMGSLDEQEVEKLIDDGDVVEVSDGGSRGSAEGRLLRFCESFCEKEYMLEEEVGTKGIDGEEKGDRHSDSNFSYGDSEEDDCSKA